MKDKDLSGIRMVAADLDGTLLYSPGRITEHAKEVIRRLRRQKIVFGVCSGRSAIALQHMLKVWGIDQDVDFILGFNGGMLFHEGQLSSWNELPKTIIPAIMECFRKYRVGFAEYQGKRMLSTQDNPVTRRMASRNRLQFVRTKPEALYRNTLKLMVIGTPWTISRCLREVQLPAGCRMFRSGPFLIEIVHASLSKLTGVLHTAQLYGLQPDQVLTFGNDNNDLEMLEGCVGVAMDNALPHIKEAADYITESNRQDGVARFLEKHILHD